MNNFLQRILTGSLFIGVILSAIWWGPTTFQVLFLLVTFLGLREYFGLIRITEEAPNKTGGILIGCLVYLLISFTASGTISAPFATLTLPLLSLLFIFELYRKKNFPFRNIAITITGILYSTVPFALLTSIAFSHGMYNRELLIGYFVLLWSSDTFAYVFGNLFGKHRLFERISPKKSWEGSIGGTLSTMFVAWAFYIFNPAIPMYQWLVMAIIICVAGTLGDLTESMLKRSLGVKDSGNILPGHGGILDRFDGLFLSVPFVWAFFQCIGS